MNTNRNHTKYIEVKYPKGDRDTINNCHLFNTQFMWSTVLGVLHTFSFNIYKSVE